MWLQHANSKQNRWAIYQDGGRHYGFIWRCHSDPEVCTVSWGMYTGEPRRRAGSWEEPLHPHFENYLAGRMSDNCTRKEKNRTWAAIKRDPVGFIMRQVL